MRTPYRVEFFSRDFTFKHHQVIPDPELELDYITLSESTIMLPKPLQVKSGWYANVLSGNNIVFQGVVSASDDPQNNMKVRIKPLISLLDVQFYKKPTGANNDAENWITQAIRQEFVNNVDESERIPGLVISKTSATTKALPALEGNVHKLWDIIQRAFESARIVASAAFYPQEKKISVTIGVNTRPAVYVETELPEITVDAFNVAPEGGVNKVEIYHKDDATKHAVFFADDYAAPTVKAIREISVGEDDDFEKKAAEAASNLLASDKFNNGIEITAAEQCRVLPDMTIGQTARVIRRGQIYTAYLTGVSIKKGMKTYTFGRRRRELTKKLRMEMNNNA